MDKFFQKSTLGSFYSNRFSTSKKKAQPLYSIVTHKVIKKLHFASPSDVLRAIDSAKEGLDSLRKMTAYEKADLLQKAKNLLLKYKDSFSEIMTLEMGKTLQEAKDEIDYAASYFSWFSAEAVRLTGKLIPSQFPNKMLKVFHEPVGIVAVITPWNFPIAMAARKIAPAIAAGCSVIVKPSPEVPVSLLSLAAIFQKIKAPKGIFNVLIGDEKMIGKKLMESNDVRKITFTGSTSVGKKLYAACSPTLKKATMELGGNAPLIVFEDADISKAVEHTLRAKFRNSGQTCVSCNRIFVQKSIFQKYVHLLLKKVKKLKVGNPFFDQNDLTSTLHPLSEKKIAKHTKDAIQKKATVLLQGKTPAHPTIITNCKANMLVFKEESFGPILAIATFEQEKEVYKKANDTPFGLAAYVFTQDMAKAQRAISTLQFGVIGLNDGSPSCSQAPFGGVKHSGFGREGSFSGIYEFVTEKYVSQML